MAFFKFRFPGRNASAQAVSSGPNENIEVVRRRARYRLIGAVVLVLMAVVGFPLVFDSQPRPVSVDTPIVIPDRQAVATLADGAPLPAAQAPAKPWKIAPETLSTQEGLGPREEVVSSAGTAQVAGPVGAQPVTQAAGDVDDKSKEQKTDKPKEKADASQAKDNAEAMKAKALLEGKSLGTERLVIQVGAFTDANKVREVRRKLEEAGLKTFTQVVAGKDDKPTTRVRVGPFDNREEADKVAARIRKLNLTPAVLKI
jgi:DedD protein